MTTRNLDALFEPKSIALIGASNQPRSVGAVTAKNLFEAGFAGPIVTVNPHDDVRTDQRDLTTAVGLRCVCAEQQSHN